MPSAALGRHGAPQLPSGGRVPHWLAVPSDSASQLRALEALQNVTSALSRAATPEQVGQVIAEHGARALDGTGGVVFALEATVLRVIGHWGDAVRYLDGRTSLPLSARTPSATAARERRTIAAATLEEFPGLPVLLGGDAVCGVPLLSGDDVLGAVGVSRAVSLHRRGHRAARGARAPDRARARTRAALSPPAARHRSPAPAAGDDGRSGARPDAAGGRRDRRGPGGGSAGSEQRLGRAAGRGRPLARAGPRRRARAGHPRAVRVAAARRRVAPGRGRADEFDPSGWRAPRRSSAAIRASPRSARRPSRPRCCRSPTAVAPLGAIGLVFDTPHRFTPDDRDYLLALTRLCGQALGRARRYQVEHDLAATLQHALLPESLPQTDGLELAVRYLPAADGIAAGGDFYDAVELPGRPSRDRGR